MNKLFLVHCGFYDSEIGEGIYEAHVNFFVSAENAQEARLKAKEIPEYQKKKMHIDGIQELEAINGHRIQMIEDPSLKGQTIVHNVRHRDLAPKTTNA